MASYKAKRPTIPANPEEVNLYIEKLLEAVNESGEKEVYDFHSTTTKADLNNQRNFLLVEIDDIEEKINAITALEIEEAG